MLICFENPEKSVIFAVAKRKNERFDTGDKPEFMSELNIIDIAGWSSW